MRFAAGDVWDLRFGILLSGDDWYGLGQGNMVKAQVEWLRSSFNLTFAVLEAIIARILFVKF